MGRTRDLFKKITDTKGPFHAKMGSIKNRNGMDLIDTVFHFRFSAINLANDTENSPYLLERYNWNVL